jgi:hypothetical protein
MVTSLCGQRSAPMRALGPPPDRLQEYGARKGRADLFSGAIYSHTNPHTRAVGLTAKDAVELIMLAGHPHRVVDERRFAP